MASVLEALPAGPFVSPRYRVRCDQCARVYVTAGWPDGLARRRGCRGCTPPVPPRRRPGDRPRKESKVDRRLVPGVWGWCARARLDVDARARLGR